LKELVAATEMTLSDADVTRIEQFLAANSK
jgi:hypothetical protein